MADKRLLRSRADRMLAGVCGGLGEYFDVDSTLVRVVYVVVSVLTGVVGGLVVYVVLALIMPEAPLSDSDEVSRPLAGPTTTAALILIVLGSLLLVANYGLLAWWAWTRLWPVIIILAGLMLLLRRRS